MSQLFYTTQSSPTAVMRLTSNVVHRMRFIKCGSSVAVLRLRVVRKCAIETGLENGSMSVGYWLSVVIGNSPADKYVVIKVW